MILVFNSVTTDFSIPNMRSGKDLYACILMFKDFLSSNAMQTYNTRKDGGKIKHIKIATAEKI